MQENELTPDEQALRQLENAISGEIAYEGSEQSEKLCNDIE